MILVHLLFKRLSPKNKMRYFSVKQSAQFLEPGKYGLALPTISFIIFSPQVKRWMIVTYTHGIYELPHKLPNDLRLTILGN